MARLAMAATPPAAASRSSSIDKVPQLVGQLNSDGIASLEADHTYIQPRRSEAPRSLKAALDAAGSSRRTSSADCPSESASEEDYDTFRHDPMAVVADGKGGGFEGNRAQAQTNGSKKYGSLTVPSNSRPGAPRLKSIPVTLNKLKEKGRYILTADDDALREILRTGIERVLWLPFACLHSAHTI
jgi:sterol O-acyltransferase